MTTNDERLQRLLKSTREFYNGYEAWQRSPRADNATRARGRLGKWNTALREFRVIARLFEEDANVRGAAADGGTYDLPETASLAATPRRRDDTELQPSNP